MSDSVRTDAVAHFAVFSLDRRSGELFRHGQRVKIIGQPVQVLEALLDRPGELVTQEDLARVLWPEGTHVDYEQGLRSAVQRLRTALDDSPETPRFIETVPRRGYRYIGPPPSPQPAVDHAAAQRPGFSWNRGKVRAVAVMAVAVLAAIVVIANWRTQPTAAGPPPEPIRLAVLPIVSVDAEDGQDPFSKGLTTELIDQLMFLQPDDLAVVSESVSSRYRDVKEIRYAVKVDFVIEGTIRRDGDRARVSLRLVPAFERTPRWGETYEVDTGDPFAAQSVIAAKVGLALPLALDLPHKPLE